LSGGKWSPMSIRIDSQQLAGAAAGAPQTSKTEEIRSNGNKSALASRVRSDGGDSVEISSMATGIAGASSAQDAQNAERVQRLSMIYAAGQYQVDSLQLSRAMVSNAITSSGGGIK
jgi:anti-sigma28 factor (negative regulator of flagellin synthesis)